MLHSLEHATVLYVTKFDILVMLGNAISPHATIKVYNCSLRYWQKCKLIKRLISFIMKEEAEINGSIAAATLLRLIGVESISAIGELLESLEGAHIRFSTFRLE